MAKRPIYYDTETTGIKAAVDRIIELAAYDPVRDARFCEFINPGCPIPPEASAIHHITDEMVSSAPPFKVVFADFLEFCEGDVVLIAHNNDGFDRHFLDAECKRSDLPPPTWSTIDSLKWARRYRPDLPRHTLQFLRETYGIAANQAHRALDDVMVLYAVFSRMIDDLSMETVLELMAAGATPDKMPFGKHRGTPLSALPADYVKWLKGSGALEKPGNADLRLGLEKAGVL